jgi:hypothetical protein
MPILVKPIGNPDNPTDGFDPESRYQMVPFGQARQVSAQTGAFEAEMKFTLPSISKMSNFRLVQQTVPSGRQLPQPTALVDQVILPSNSIIEFTLTGAGLGTTHLEGRDLPGLGAPPLAPDFKLEVAVKDPTNRRLAVCYVFDQINQDTGQRTDFGGLFLEVSRIFEQQANCSIVNIDGQSSSGPQARTLTLASTSGKTFDLVDPVLMARVIDGFEKVFPGVFAQTDFVLFAMAVPLQVGRRRPIALQINLHRTSNGSKFYTLFLSPTQGMKRISLRRTLAHETGHTFGLNHNPREQPSPPPDPDLLPTFMHNLMFPTDLVSSTRLTRSQIENIHSFIPPFRTIEF